MTALLNASFWIEVALLAAIYGIFSLGLQLNLGLTGVYNFGQVGFMAVGAYAMAMLVLIAHWSIWYAIPAAIAFAMMAGVLVGLTALRLRADYFAVTSLAFATIVQLVALNARELTGGGQGLLGFDTDWTPLAAAISQGLQEAGLPDSPQLPLLLVSTALLLCLVGRLRWLKATPWGRALVSIRDDEVLAAALGKNVFSYKLQSLAIAAGLAALAGCLLALDLLYLVPDDFGAQVTFTGFTILLLGGWTSFTGVLFGTVILWFVLETTRFVNFGLSDDQAGAMRFILVGLVLVLFARFRPGGLLGKRRRITFSE